MRQLEDPIRHTKQRTGSSMGQPVMENIIIQTLTTLDLRLFYEGSFINDVLGLQEEEVKDFVTTVHICEY